MTFNQRQYLLCKSARQGPLSSPLNLSSSRHQKRVKWNTPFLATFLLPFSGSVPEAEMIGGPFQLPRDPMKWRCLGLVGRMTIHLQGKEGSTPRHQSQMVLRRYRVQKVFGFVPKEIVDDWAIGDTENVEEI